MQKYRDWFILIYKLGNSCNKNFKSVQYHHAWVILNFNNKIFELQAEKLALIFRDSLVETRTPAIQKNSLLRLWSTEYGCCQKNWIIWGSLLRESP